MTVINTIETAIANPILSVWRKLSDEEQALHDEIVSTAAKLHDLVSKIEDSTENEFVLVKTNILDDIRGVVANAHDLLRGL